MTGVTDIVLARNEFARMLRESGADLSLIASFDRLSDSIAGMRQSVSQMRMRRSEAHTGELPSLLRITASVYCLIKKHHKAAATVSQDLTRRNGNTNRTRA